MKNDTPTQSKIINLRHKSGLTQTEFAELVSASKKTVQAWECGSRNMPIVTWLYLQHVLGVKKIEFSTAI